MSRIPALPRDELPDSLQPVHDHLASFATSKFGNAFTYKDPSNGALLGPFPFYVASGQFGATCLDFFGHFSSLPGLSKEARETAILAVGARYQAGFELYSHTNVARKATGLSDEQVESLAKGVKPEGLGDDCTAAFDAAVSLVSKPGALPQELWDRSIKALGKEGTISLVHFVGYYACEYYLHDSAWVWRVITLLTGG